MSDTITEINVREGVTIIPDQCCRYCVKLTTVILPASLLSIGSFGFHGCKSLRNITLPNSLSSIGHCCFTECTSLTSIVIPNSVTSLGDDIGCVFSGCKSLSKVVLPHSLSSIPRYTFTGCYSLKSLVIPDSVRSIDERAFLGCTALTSINIPDNATIRATENGFYSFENCTKLKAIAASNNMKIEDYFRNSHLKKIKQRATVLLCLQFINARRMEGGEIAVTKKRRLNNNEKGSVKTIGEEANVVGFSGVGSGGENVYISDQSFNGVLAEEMLTDFAWWREILEYL